MRRMITLMAVVALAACDSATGAERGAQDTRTAQTPEGPSLSTGHAGMAHRTAIASVRKTGSGTYTAQGLVADGNGVYVEVRRSTSGFSTLTSGTLVTYGQSSTGEVTVNFSTISGNRYLVAAFPADGSIVDINHPHFIEAVP